MNDPRERRNAIIEVVSAILRIPAHEAEGGISPESVPDWDSERHVELVVALEERFDCMFEAEDIPELTSLESMEEILARHGA